MNITMITPVVIDGSQVQDPDFSDDLIYAQIRLINAQDVKTLGEMNYLSIAVPELGTGRWIGADFSITWDKEKVKWFEYHAVIDRVAKTILTMIARQADFVGYKVAITEAAVDTAGFQGQFGHSVISPLRGRLMQQVERLLWETNDNRLNITKQSGAFGGDETLTINIAASRDISFTLTTVGKDIVPGVPTFTIFKQKMSLAVSLNDIYYGGQRMAGLVAMMDKDKLNELFNETLHRQMPWLTADQCDRGLTFPRLFTKDLYTALAAFQEVARSAVVFMSTTPMPMQVPMFQRAPFAAGQGQYPQNVYDIPSPFQQRDPGFSQHVSQSRFDMRAEAPRQPMMPSTNPAARDPVRRGRVIGEPQGKRVDIVGDPHGRAPSAAPFDLKNAAPKSSVRGINDTSKGKTKLTVKPPKK